MNSYVYVCQYREARRAALYDDPDWLTDLTGVAEMGYQTGQDNTLLRPASSWTPAKND